MARSAGWIAGIAAMLAATTALGEPLVVALLTDRTGPAAASGTRIANGARDYLTMLDRRDGGVAGRPLTILECEVGADEAKAAACHGQAVAAGAVVVLATERATTRALAAVAGRARVPLLSLADGFAVATRGDVMPWLFNPSDATLGGITVAVRAIADLTGREADLTGLSIGLVHDAETADPASLDVMRDLAARLGFTPRFYALSGEAGGLRDLGPQRPDYLVLLGRGPKADTAVEDALAAGMPPDRLVALHWPDDAVLHRLGTGARGFREVSRHAFGDHFPAFDEIDVHVIDRGLSRTPKDGSGEPLYNRGVYGAVLLAEAIRGHGRTQGGLTGDGIRRGFETLSIDGIRWKELGLAGFARAVSFDCRDHGGRPALSLQTWDGAKWAPSVAPIAQERALVDARLDTLVIAFRAAHPDWPARTEPCADRS
ncbi:ABC transporter substrate-binding protein [Methylobacterium sp. Leaf466]|uniref:ABC transporter substrate-binding protein n=1 Tax=Methylobacterium sp. Leaf466 TaxID=1736386 RepID=UPI000B020E27|nr:ABC transporter substrate-binding protein [Methylobacterium sp. Leaf466]